MKRHTLVGLLFCVLSHFAVAAGFLLGVSGVGWALVLYLQGGGEEVKAITSRYIRRLFLFSLSSMLFSFLIVMSYHFFPHFFSCIPFNHGTFSKFLGLWGIYRCFL